MGSTNGNPRVPAGPARAEVRLELERILSSPAFRGSKRGQDFLTFVVGQALEGDVERLKERTIAVKVFGRSEDANLADDSIVRVGAREVRKRLAQYYAAQGVNNLVRIELPAGTYVPAFQYQRPAEPEPAESAMDAMAVDDAASVGPPVAMQRPSHNAAAWVPVAGLLLLAGIALLIWQWMHRPSRDFEAFWRPALESKGPALVVVSGAAHVPFGDAEAAFRIAGLFGARGRGARLKGAADIADLRSPVMVLAGAQGNRWTLEATRNLRYRFLNSGGQLSLVDAVTGERWSGGEYLLVCRIPHAEAGGALLVAAGLTPEETGAAGRIVTDAGRLAPLLTGLPSDWAGRNLELVIRWQTGARVPQVVRSLVW